MAKHRLVHLETRPREEHSGHKVRTAILDRLSVLNEGKRRMFIAYSSRGSWQTNPDENRSR